VRTIERSISLDEVCELIAAAGPLTVADIAGGLDAPAGQVAAYVQSMVGHGDLQEDEFGRYVLRGHCLEQS
jgi:DNA-binding IclR family transcriptional regulator